MFTGIIEELGTVENVQLSSNSLWLTVSAPTSASELQINDSVSVNGVCLTVVHKERLSFDVEAVEETLKKTALKSLRVQQRVNLELPMRLNERLGGHLVLGHVDTTGKIIHIEHREGSWIFAIDIPRQFLHYIIPVGSIAVDGVSLTIAEVRSTHIRVSIIPHTMENTIFKLYKTNDEVNLEFDMVGKYIEQLSLKYSAKENSIITEQYLKESGF